MVDTAAIIKQAFGSISDEDIGAMGRVATVQTYPAEHVLCHEGAVEHIFYIVAEGQVAITQKLGAGEPRFIAAKGPGEFFGEMALIDHKPRTATITTTGPATVLEISEQDFENLLAQSPNMALAMIRRFVTSIRASGQQTITDLTQKNTELARAYDDLKAAQAELVAKEKLERELEIAGEVQRSLLPSRFPKVQGYSFAGRNVAARHVGGDLYDVIKIDDEHVGLLLADVSDKGVHAALIMAVTRTLFLSQARHHLSPAAVALAVHDGILEVSSNDDMFVTVFYGVLHLPSGRVRYIRAGQDKPLLFRAAGGPPETLEADGRFLGMLPDLHLEERETQLGPGDLLLAYSDGVPDAIDLTDAPYGLERMVRLISERRSAPASEVCSSIFTDVFAFRGTAPAFDDITVLATRCHNGQ